MDYHQIVKPGHSPAPEEPRPHCTDCAFCLLFTLFLASFLSISSYGFSHGNPDLILYPFDVSGNQCGLPDSATSSYPYLYYIDPIDNPVYTVCVKDCSAPCATYHPNTWVLGCISHLGFEYREDNTGSVGYAIEYTGKGFLGRFCMPEKSAEEVYRAVSGEIDTGGVLEWAQDVMYTWPAALAVLGISLTLSLMYMCLLRTCTGVMVYSTIVAVLLVFIGVGWELRQQAGLHSDSSLSSNPTVLTYLSYTSFALCGLFLLLTLFMWRRISLAIAIMKCSVLFMGDTCSILLVPIVTFLFSAGLIAFWLFALGYIYSCGSVEHKDQYTAFGNVSWDENTRKMFYFLFLSLLWLLEFLHYLTVLVLSLVVYHWYFHISSSFPICLSLYISLRYHLGSVSLASLLISLVKLVKWFFSYLQTHVYSANYQGNQLVLFLCLCLSCYVAYFERVIQYIDKNALIAVSFTKQNFCRSAKEVILLIIDNGIRFLAVGSIGELLSFLGKSLITALSVGLGCVLIDKIEYFEGKLSSPVAPVVVFALIGYGISSIFMSVFEMTADCLIIFYLEDEKRHGSRNLMHSPEVLHEFMSEERSKVDEKCCFCL